MTDGNITAATTALHRAVADMFTEQRKQFAGRTLTAPSLYRQLQDLIHGETGERSGGRPGAPLYVDALEIMIRIDTESARMCRGTSNVETRIHWLINHQYRPQDSTLVEGWANQIVQWTRLTQAILDPEPHWTLPEPCPECRRSVVYRTVAGEEIRQPALHITSEGCRCHHCRTLWTPEKFELLAKILKPEEVHP